MNNQIEKVTCAGPGLMQVDKKLEEDKKKSKSLAENIRNYLSSIGDMFSSENLGLDESSINADSLQFNGFNVELIVTNEAGVVAGKLVYNPGLMLFEISDDFSYHNPEILEKVLGNMNNDEAFKSAAKEMFIDESQNAGERLLSVMNRAAEEEQDMLH